ncbi:MAG: response regulator [Mesorhizobium sp.]|uniref:response regulator n=2 Tax=Mesorhizobium TaxID=68287 RepID=UPI000F75C0FC|nr:MULTISPECIES: response regulator [unclassified Mesorhizobium]RUY13343.1 response regulator [Mesorhizobium sp. M2A.F.Ca.ET.040.01.1.1]RVC71217.1 response regulator [Mesorhizobium sp. M00.F.Ca.ET.038.03.1.1]RVC74661.1 response regulator [Mesorhizobium sp. M2A.F.Ca.ET.046.02.1.1]AZO34722.1 response regulator [Mesorhizobium sp. M2A.F.Ca.ET.046.03.2.1]RWA92949.1 MAG: response regulator [Mesorhizobium sp.]
MSSFGRILVVDDSAMVRIKLKKAVETLGHEAVAVESGAAALDQTAGAPFDLVLLDIMMPEMDGFEVLKRLKSSAKTRDLPVIVISALDEEMNSVVHAIELGAEDFLPKDFELALLKARVATCIEKKRLRDIEKEYLRQVTKLTRAAATLESGRFNPSKLGIQDVASRTDGLGKLATVFSTMAQKVYERERKLRQNIRTFRGGLLLLACGGLWGLVVPLSKMASIIEAHPVGLALLIDTIGAAVCIGISVNRKTMPNLKGLTRTDWIFILLLALISSVINQVLVYWMASRLPAFIVSIVIVLEGFVVFLFAAVMRTEAPNVKRFLGLGLGLAGIVIILIYGQPADMTASWLWIAIAMVIPVTYATEDIFLAERRPAAIDSVALFGITLVVSVALLIPIAAYYDDFIPLDLLTGRLGVIVVLMAVAANLAMLLFMVLISTTGAVFASQSAYAVTAAGIGWSMLLLGEAIPILTWASLALIIVGLIMVEPKQEAEEEPPLLDDTIEDLVPRLDPLPAATEQSRPMPV